MTNANKYQFKPDKNTSRAISEVDESRYQNMIDNIRGNIKLEVTAEDGLGIGENEENTFLKLIDTFGAKGSDAAQINYRLAATAHDVSKVRHLGSCILGEEFCVKSSN